MAGGVQYLHTEIADGEGVAIGKQRVKLAAVAGKLRAGIKHLAENLLHLNDVFTDADFAAQLLLQIRRRRKVVGMGVGFQYPLHLQTCLADMGNQLIGGMGIGAAAAVIKSQYRIDDGTGIGRRIAYQIGESVGGWVEKSADLRLGIHNQLLIIIMIKN